MDVILQLLRFLAKILLILTRWVFGLGVCPVLSPGVIQGLFQGPGVLGFLGGADGNGGVIS